MPAAVREHEAHGGGGSGEPVVVPGGVVAQRRRRGPRADRAARAAGHGVRGARRAPTDHRASTPRSSASSRYAIFGPSKILVLGPGLVARADDRGDAHPAGRRRAATRSGRSRWRRRSRCSSAPSSRVAGHRQARLRRRPDLEADDHRLHERPGAHDPRRPAPEALRVLGRRRRLPRRAHGASSRGWPTARRWAPRSRSACSGWSLIVGPAALAARRCPGVLVAVVLSIAAAAVFDLADHGVSLVGVLPAGLPAVHPARRRVLRPRPRWSAARSASRSSRSPTRSPPRRRSRPARGDEVDGQREMIGIGAANLAAGLFQGFPVSTSGSRTAVAEQAGAKTQVTGSRRRGGDRADPAVLPRPAARPPAADARRGRDRRVAVAGRHPRDACASTGCAGPSSC